MNLTPPPSQNSYAVRWHSTAESKRRVAEIIILLLLLYYYYKNCETEKN